MPDDLYVSDFVLWSADQARKLRRLSRGEQVNDIDWRNVIEEVESLGRSETKAVRKLVLRALELLLKIIAFPAAPGHDAWLNEATTFLSDAKLDWTPVMDRKINLNQIYRMAARNVRNLAYREGPACELPATCPLKLRDVLPKEAEVSANAIALLEKLRAAC